MKLSSGHYPKNSITRLDCIRLISPDPQPSPFFSPTIHRSRSPCHVPWDPKRSQHSPDTISHSTRGPKNQTSVYFDTLMPCFCFLLFSALNAFEKTLFTNLASQNHQKQLKKCRPNELPTQKGKFTHHSSQ